MLSIKPHLFYRSTCTIPIPILTTLNQQHIKNNNIKELNDIIMNLQYSYQMLQISTYLIRKSTAKIAQNNINESIKTCDCVARFINYQLTKYQSSYQILPQEHHYFLSVPSKESKKKRKKVVVLLGFNCQAYINLYSWLLWDAAGIISSSINFLTYKLYMPIRFQIVVVISIDKASNMAKNNPFFHKPFLLKAQIIGHT